MLEVRMGKAGTKMIPQLHVLVKPRQKGDLRPGAAMSFVQLVTSFAKIQTLHLL